MFPLVFLFIWTEFMSISHLCREEISNQEALNKTLSSEFVILMIIYIKCQTVNGDGVDYWTVAKQELWLFNFTVLLQRHL